MAPRTETGKLFVIIYTIPGMLLMMSYLNIFSTCILIVLRKVSSQNILFFRHALIHRLNLYKSTFSYDKIHDNVIISSYEGIASDNKDDPEAV